MGKKSSRESSSSKPPKWAIPTLKGALGNVQDTISGNQGNLDAMAGQVRGFLPQLGEMAFGENTGLNAATGYATDVLGGKYLGQGNPYLNDMAALARQNVGGDINSMFSRAGRAGSDTHFQDLAEGMGKAELGLRYQDYGNERNAQTQAAGMIPALNQSQYAGVMPYLAAQQTAAGLPYTGIQNYGVLGSILGGYGTQTQGGGGGGWGNAIASGIATALPFVMPSERQTKADIEEIGLWDGRDGLKRYRFRYKADETRTLYEGVMVDEVERLRPHALGPTLRDGRRTVNYAKLSEAA